MPYKLVSYIDNNKLFINAFPNNWEKNNLLYWPPEKEDFLKKNENSVPDDSWSSGPCKIKLLDITSLKEGLSLENKYINFTDTESEERYLKSVANKRRHQLRKMEMHEQRNFNEMMIDASGTLFVPVRDNILPAENKMELLQQPEKDCSNNYVFDVQSSNCYTNNFNMQEETANLQSERNNCTCNLIQEKISDLEKRVESLNQNLYETHAKIDSVGTNSKDCNKRRNVRNRKNESLLKNIKFPLRSHEDILLLEEQLRNSEFEMQMIQKLSSIGGRSGKNCAHIPIQKMRSGPLMGQDWRPISEHRAKTGIYRWAKTGEATDDNAMPRLATEHRPSVVTESWPSVAIKYRPFMPSLVIKQPIKPSLIAKRC